MLSRKSRVTKNIKTIADNIFKPFQDRIESLFKEIVSIGDERSTQLQAYDKYISQANSVSLSEDIKSKIRDGSIDISKYDSDTTEKINEYKDFYEKALEAADAIEELGEDISSVYKDYFEIIETGYDNILSQIEHDINVLETQIEYASTRANGQELKSQYSNELIQKDKEYLERLRNEKTELENTLSLGVSTGAIPAYTEGWYEFVDKINDVDEKIHDTVISIADRYQDAMDYIEDEYDAKLDNISSQADILDSRMELAETNGLLASTRYYEAMAGYEAQRHEELLKERESLEQLLNEAVEGGKIEEYSERWYELKNRISDVTKETIEAAKATAEYNNEARQITWDRFDYAQDAISELTDESEFLLDLLGDDLFGDNGQLNDKGMAAMGLRGLNYNTYMEQALAYAREIDKIDSDINNNPHDDALLQRRKELVKLQRDSILAAQDEKDAMKTLIEDGIEEETNALKDLIDKYESSLDSAKDLFDYQRKISDQTKDIASLQKQLSAYENDTSEETKATVQKLKVDLEQAQQDLRDTEYDKYVSDTKELLDNIYTEYESLLNNRMDNIDKYLETSIDDINNNASSIKSTLISETGKFGTTISTTMNTVWSNQKSALQDYFGQGSTLESFYLSADGYFQNGWVNHPTGLQTALANILAAKNDELRYSSGEAAKYTDDSYKNQMRQNSLAWFTSDTATQRRMEEENQEMGNYLHLNYRDGRWYDNDGTLYYDISDEEKVHSIIDAMKANSAKWFDADAGERTALEEQQDKLAGYIEEITGKHVYRTEEGIWYIDGKELYSYKTGGLANFTGAAWLDGTPSKPELVLNARDTENFIALKNALTSIVKSNSPLLSKRYSGMASVAHLGNFSDVSGALSNLRGQSNVSTKSIGNININIPIDHVENYDDFITQLQKDKQFERLIRSVSVDLLSGGSTLEKNKYQW